MKTILVPVDFSKPSENALQVAAQLAKKNNSKIVILHVVELAESLFGTDQFNVDNQEVMFFLKMAKKRFTKFLEKPYLEGVDVEDQVEIGPTSFMINKSVEENKVDLVIMGSVGASGLKEVLIGSNTEKIVRKSEVPVLVVKKEMKDFAINNVIFASNFELENLKPFEKAKEFAKQFDAKMKLLYVNLPGNQFYSTEEIREQMRAFLHKVEVPYAQENVMIYNDYTIELGVLNGAKDAKADLIAMPTHGRRGISHFFNGSIGEDVVNHSTLPVITFKIDK
ncbi:universal stress protein [Psychroflexus salis]|uniref:Universal stress protein UspA n=1 Tax=Psychroflexus salis TaxID=1526574 RepID=A0A916ZRI0_9FLAO|nr:universal stress protein [Psychroflexus salis]GGE10395.1 universal stress protein UspA [Psychroflexus salis]